MELMTEMCEDCLIKYCLSIWQYLWDPKNLFIITVVHNNQEIRNYRLYSN